MLKLHHFCNYKLTSHKKTVLLEHEISETTKRVEK